MAQIKKPYLITIPQAGSVFSLPVDSYDMCYYIANDGTTALAGNVTIAPSGSPSEGCHFEFYYFAQEILSIYNITIFGRNMTKDEAKSVCFITAKYISSTWHVDITILNNGRVFGKFFGATGDTNAGYMADKINISQFQVNPATYLLELVGAPNEILYREVNFPDAVILDWNATPQIAIPDPGAGKAIVLLDVVVSKTKDWSAPYATNTNVHFYTNTATKPQFIDVTSLLAVADRIINVKSSAITIGVTDTQVVASEPLMVKVDAGNPTGGGLYNELTYGLFYKIITA